jgi:hypothetical protein
MDKLFLNILSNFVLQWKQHFRLTRVCTLLSDASMFAFGRKRRPCVNSQLRIIYADYALPLAA